MHNLLTNARRGLVALGTGAVMLAGTSAIAADKVSGEFGVSYNSHFMSYGLDVWGAGGDFFGDKSTKFVWGSVTVAPTDAFSVNFGAWADVNDNADPTIGSEIQEVDVWLGGSYTIDKVTLGATYQQWIYGGDVEEIVDLSLGYDDTGLLADGFALNPGLTWHIRTEGNGSQEEGSVLVLSVGPSFALNESLSLTIPAGIGYFLTDDFQGGTDDGLAYSYVGGSLSYPLAFIPADYGSWAMNFDLIAYFTEEASIPGNPEENFLTGSVGLTLAF